MPFRSKAQKRWMYANKPGMAEQWQKETPSEASLPEHTSKKGKIKKAEPAPPKGVSMKDWGRILRRGPGKVKKAYLSADFPNAAGPEDWDAQGDSPWKQGEPKQSKDKLEEKKEKVSQGDEAYFDGDGSRLMPSLRVIHKLGHVKQASTASYLLPALAAPFAGVAEGRKWAREKTAQGEFEYADLGPTPGEMSAPVRFQMPGKLKRSAGLDQERGLDDQQAGQEPGAAFPTPEDPRRPVGVPGVRQGYSQSLSKTAARAFGLEDKEDL